MKSRPKFGFSIYTDSNLKTKLSLIIQMMTGNPQFPNPVPNLTTLQSKVSEYEGALIGAATRAIGAAAHKNQVREEAELLFKELAGYIMSQTSDKAVIESTGFDATGEYGPVGHLPAPVIKVTSGQSAVSIDITPVRGAVNYIVEICDTDPQQSGSEFHVVGNPTQSHFEMAIPPLVYRWVRVRANGTAGEGDYSAIVRCSAF